MIHFVTVAVTVFLQPPHAVVSEIQVKLSQSHRAPNNFLGLSKCTVQFSRTRRRNPYSFTWLYDTYQQTSLSHRRGHGLLLVDKNVLHVFHDRKCTTEGTGFNPRFMDDFTFKTILMGHPSPHQTPQRMLQIQYPEVNWSSHTTEHMLCRNVFGLASSFDSPASVM